VRTYTTTTSQKPKVIRTITKKVLVNLENGCQLVEIDGVIYYDFRGKTLNLAIKEEEVDRSSQAVIVEKSRNFKSLNTINIPLELIVLTIHNWECSHFKHSVANQIFLKKVTFTHNNIVDFPPSWLKLTNMEDFECSNNQLSKLPDGLVISVE
jgi:hypothetical protein